MGLPTATVWAVVFWRRPRTFEPVLISQLPGSLWPDTIKTTTARKEGRKIIFYVGRCWREDDSTSKSWEVKRRGVKSVL
jgi:hypothetical protein